MMLNKKQKATLLEVKGCDDIHFISDIIIIFLMFATIVVFPLFTGHFYATKGSWAKLRIANEACVINKAISGVEGFNECVLFCTKLLTPRKTQSQKNWERQKLGKTLFQTFPAGLGTAFRKRGSFDHVQRLF